MSISVPSAPLFADHLLPSIFCGVQVLAPVLCQSVLPFLLHSPSLIKQGNPLRESDYLPDAGDFFQTDIAALQSSNREAEPIPFLPEEAIDEGTCLALRFSDFQKKPPLLPSSLLFPSQSP